MHRLAQWARDAAGAVHISIRSARSLLTVTTRVMDVGIIADDAIEIPVSAISSDVIAATVMIDGNVDAVIATEMGTIDAGDAGTGESA